MRINMNKKFSALIVAILLLAIPARADEYYSDVSDVQKRANFRRVALDMASTEVSNAQYYKDSPNSKLSADSKTTIKGVFDFVYEIEQADSQWNNGVFAEYGRTKLKPADGESTTSTDADEILIYTDYNRKMWKFTPDKADIGPFASLGYETEFEKSQGDSREKIVRGKSGMKLFNGEKVKELYAAGVVEYDFTHIHDDILRTAYEIGWRGEYKNSDQVKFQLEGYYRKYLTYSNYMGTDLKYELNVTSRMDVKVNDKFSLAPYISYIQGQARNTNKIGSNFMLGLSLAYSNIFDL